MRADNTVVATAEIQLPIFSRVLRSRSTKRERCDSREVRLRPDCADAPTTKAYADVVTDGLALCADCAAILRRMPAARRTTRKNDNSEPREPNHVQMLEVEGLLRSLTPTQARIERLRSWRRERQPREAIRLLSGNLKTFASKLETLQNTIPEILRTAEELAEPARKIHSPNGFTRLVKSVFQLEWNDGERGMNSTVISGRGALRAGGSRCRSGAVDWPMEEYDA
jgi:hypothetical protein